MGSISNNLQAWRPATLSKRDSNTGVHCGYYEIFKNIFLIEHLRLLLLTVLPQYSKVSWGVCSLFLRLHVPSILIKNLRKTLLKKFFTIMWPNNCLDFLITCFRFQNMIWKNILMRNLHKALRKKLCNITCQKTFFACTLWLVKCFKFQDMIWKTEECRVSEKTELKTWREKSRFWFCSTFVYFTDFTCLCCSFKLFYLYRAL